MKIPLRCSVVFEPLGYKPEGSRPNDIHFSIYLVLQAALGPRLTQPLTEISTKNIKRIMFLESKVFFLFLANLQSTLQIEQ
jgi:hypothetical protein